MIYFQTSESKKFFIEIFLLNVILVLYLFRSAVPQFKYPFILLFLFYSSYEIIQNRNGIILGLKKYIQNYYLILMNVAIFYLAFLSSDELFLPIFKEAMEIIILLTLLFIMSLKINSKLKLDIFVSNLMQLILIFSFFIVLINTYVLIEIQNYYGFYPANNYQNEYLLNSLLLDKNFALLPIFFGYIIIIDKLNKHVSKFKLIVYNLVLLLFIFNVIVTASKRGIIILLIIILVLSILRILLFFHLDIPIKKTVRNLSIFYVSIFLIPAVLFTVIHYGSYDFKVGTLKLLGVKDISSVKRTITSSTYNLVRRFDREMEYSSLDKILWSTTFDPKDPNNGWGFGYYKTVFPLKGENSNIVPKGSIGYSLDNSCYYDHSDHHAYSNTPIANLNVTEKDTLKASVFCYVSNDFNGDLVCLRADGQTYGNRVSQYNLNLKGSWQMLSISAICNNGKAPLGLYFNKQDVTDFSSLTGYVLFAFPQFKHIRITDSLYSQNSSLSGNLLWRSEKAFYKTGDLDKKVNTLNISISTEMEYSGEVFFNCNNRNGSPIYISNTSFPLVPLSILRLYAGSVNSRLSTDSAVIDTDIFRNWINIIIPEDTNYYGTKTTLWVDTTYNSFLNDRLSRWQFALQIYNKEYNCSQRIFGGGYNFLGWYGFYFLNNKNKTDYPHNPLLYILLYSGILGLAIYLICMFYVFKYYLMYCKDYSLLFIFFIMTYTFTFFSGGNPFDPPIMGFFIIIPFFIHYTYKEQNQTLIRFK